MSHRLKLGRLPRSGRFPRAGHPEDWKERDYHPELDSWETVSSINAALTELGQVVSEVLKAEYIDWEASFDAPDDLPDFG